jgi:hypothetical protein
LKPGILYRINFQNFDGDFIRIDMADASVQIDDASDPEVRLLTGTGNPLHIRVIDNSEDKLTSIRAKQATIEFRSDVNYHIGTFADGPDNRFEVTCYLNPTTSNIIFFRGFIVPSDLEQLFLPNPQVVVLTASDQLGLLKDVALSADNGDYIKGKFKMSYYIAQCLKKTGLRLPIKVVNNLRVGSGKITIQAAFLVPANVIFTTFTGFFYPGQRIRITNSASNNGDYTVGDVGLLGGTLVAVTMPLTAEGTVMITVEDISSTSHIYDTVYIDSLTFEADIGTAQDCYTVLEKLLKDGETLTEYQGGWWINRIDEYDGNAMYVATFDADGNYVGIEEMDLSKPVGRDEAVKFATADNLLRLDRPKGSITETFRYEFPQELVCNINWERGEYVSDLPAVTVDDVTFDAKRYTVECWEYAKHRARGLSPLASQSQGYVKKLYYNDQERDRYLRIDTWVPSGGGEYVPDSFKSEALQVNQTDKVIVNSSVRFNNFDNGDSPDFLGIELVGNDGSYWYAYSPVPFSGKFLWFNYGGGPLTAIITMQGPAKTSDDDYTQWQTFNLESAPIPVSGNLYFYLPLDIPTDTGSYQEFSDFSVEYLPFINGSYRQYSGQSYSVRRTDPGYSANRENEVFISNAPITAMKGGMFISNETGFYLTPRYYASAPFALGPPTDQSAVNTYGYLQAFAVWNQNRNTIRKFQGTTLHLGEAWPDIIHKFSLTDTNPNTDNRYFLLISFDQDWKSCLTTATFIEVYRFDGKVYTDPWTFKYITQ